MLSALLLAALLVTIKSDVSSPANGGQSVTFYAEAKGGSGQYEYRWFRLPTDNGEYVGLWSVVREWNSTPTFTYSPPTGGGSQYFGVWVRERGTDFVYDGTNGTSIPFVIRAAPTPVCGPMTLSALGLAESNFDALHYLPLDNKAYTAGSWPFPFTVPEGKTFNISSIHYKGKKIRWPDGTDHFGGVILTNIFTVSQEDPLIFPTPLPIPGGTIISGFFSNDTASSPMNEMVLIVGTLTGPGC